MGCAVDLSVGVLAFRFAFVYFVWYVVAYLRLWCFGLELVLRALLVGFGLKGLCACGFVICWLLVCCCLLLIVATC